MNDHIDMLQSRPTSIAVEISSKCNLRCGYCHKSNHVLEAMAGANDDMREETIADTFRYCKEAGIRNVTLSMGGETTTVAGWYERVARFIDDPDTEAHMVSNFVRPFSDEELEALTKFKALQISLDSSDLAMVRKLRSKADLGTIAYNIIRLKQAGSEFGRCPFLVVNCTLCRDNIGHVAKLAGFCRALGVDQLMLTEVMLTTQHEGMPETLDSLTDDEVLLLARQIAAAEDALRTGNTALRLREHLRIRIGELVEQLREGFIPTGAGAYFHRHLATSACRQPWQTPMVGATGNVISCCGSSSVGPVGNLGTHAMGEIMEGVAARAIRASILDGRPSVACRTCSFAQAVDFPEFVRGIREMQGDTNLPPPPTDVQSAVWPGLLGSSCYPVVLENSLLQVDSQGRASLAENALDGYHRILFDIARAAYSQVSFRVRPAGRRRFRFDWCDERTPIGRTNVVLSRSPRSTTEIGEISCLVIPAEENYYDVKACFPQPQPISEIVLFMMREDDAVRYGGDGRSGLEISDLSLA